MDFSEVLVKAWRIVWKHKVLWIFGILAGCGTGGGGSSGGGGGGGGWQQDSPFPGGTGDVERWIQQAGEYVSEHWWVVVLAILAFILLYALVLFLGTIGKIGLVRGAFHVDGGAEALRFGELFRESTPYFWRVFLLSFLVGVGFLIVFLPLLLFGAVTAGLGFLCLLPLMCVLLPLVWAVGIVITQANSAMVIEDLSLVDGVRRGWEVFRKNIGPMLLIWLITGVLGLVVGFVLVLPFAIIVLPAIFGAASSQADLSSTAFVVSGLCCAVYLPIMIVAGGIMTAYVQSVWTLTYLRLTRPGTAMEMPAATPANA